VPRLLECLHNAGRSVVITEEVGDSCSLACVWTEQVEPLRDGRRRVAAALAEAVGRSFAAAHRAGFIHRDTHPENILVQERDGCRAFFVDVRGARLLRGPVSVKQAAHTLAQLDHYFRRRATRTERLRFLIRYLGRSAARLGPDGRAWIAAIAHAGIAHARALARQRDRRLKRDGKYFGALDLGHRFRATVVLKLARRHVFPERDVPDRTTGEWCELLRSFAEGGRPASDSLIVEESLAASLPQRLSWSLAGSSARRAFLRCHCLRHRDVPSDLMLGYVEHRNRLGVIDRAWLIRPNSAECRRTARTKARGSWP
jgi:hypothetical protein